MFYSIDTGYNYYINVKFDNCTENVLVLRKYTLKY